MAFGRRIRVEQSRRKDHKSWRDQKTLRTTGRLRVFSGPCPSCSSRVESASHPGQWLHQRQPYVHCPHRHKRILPGRDSASKQPLCFSRFFASSRAGRKLCPPQLRQLSSRHAADALPAPPAGPASGTALALGSNTAASYRAQMRARAPSADATLGIEVHDV